MAAKWSGARPCEGDAYHNRRMSIVKVLSEYILSLGQEAYIPNFFCKAYRPALYIPSKDEVKELLRKMDIRTSHNSEQLRLDRECKILFSCILLWAASVRRAAAKVGIYRPGKRDPYYPWLKRQQRPPCISSTGQPSST